MDVTRRNFLKVMGASALGTVLFNACRWPETELEVQSPVEIPEDTVRGIDAYYATQCGVCTGGCGVVVRVMEGRAKKVEGNPDFPINRGKHSARCEAGLQALYHPDRVRTPLWRDDRSTPFRAISWQEARQRLVDRLGELRGRRDAVVLVTQPLRGHLGLVVGRFASAYGARHVPFEPMEQAVLRRAIKSVFNQDRLPDLDIENARFILSFGADFLGTWVSPVRFARGYGEFRKQGDGHSRGTFVQVDSHFSLTTANADEWLPVNPGTEGVLALSIAHVIISEGLGNPQAADALTGGAGARALDAFRPEVAAGIIGVSAEKIQEVARAFAQERPSLAIGGDSAAAHTNGLFNLTAIYSLNYLVDAVNEKGGIIFNPAPPLNLPGSSGGVTLQQWQELTGQMRDGRVEALVLRGANPVHGLPAAISFAEAMGRVPFVAVFATVLDETAARADLVLPEHTPLEAWGGDVPDPGPGYRTVGFQQPVVRPLHDSRSFGDELLQIGKDLGLPWGTLKEALEQGARDLQALNRGSVRSATVEGFWNGALQRGGWWDTSFRANGATPTPPRLPTQVTPPSFEGADRDFPFTLTVFRSLALAEGQNAHLPWLQATPDPITTVVWQTWVEVNTRTASELGLREGDIVAVESQAGSIEVPVYPHPAVPPGTVAIPAGQGHTSYGRYAENRGANVLSILAPATERETGALAWGATRVRLRKTGKFRKASKFEGAVAPFPLGGEANIVHVTRPE